MRTMCMLQLLHAHKQQSSTRMQLGVEDTWQSIWTHLDVVLSLTAYGLGQNDAV